MVLPDFAKRKQVKIYRSTLRAAVRKVDPVKPARTFPDKEEWKQVLLELQAAGTLTYQMDSDTVFLPVAATATADL